MKKNMRKRVLLLTTGGTISFSEGKEGLAPDLKGKDILSFLPELKNDFSVDRREILNLDSSNIQPEEWQLIAAEISKALPLYDGIIVTHGTDTMAYTASALCFMLRGLYRPVVLTGAQIPMDRMFTDAKRNLQTAFAAVSSGIPKVMIAFYDRIINGCRAVKVRTLGFNAFESISAPYIGEVFADGVHFYHTDKSLSPWDEKAGIKSSSAMGTVSAGERQGFYLADKLCPDVFLLKLIPGTNPDIFDMLLHMNYRGLVIEAFGAGGTHFERRNLLPRLKRLVDSGVSVVARSQCLYEKSDFSLYEVGRKLLDCGVIPGRDMTTEAIVAKLMWALGQTNDPREVQKIFEVNYAGEVTL